MRVIQGYGYRGEADNAASQQPQHRTYAAQIEINCSSAVEPADAGNETNQSTDCDPWLWRNTFAEVNPQILDHGRPPGRREKPMSRQKRNRGRAYEREKDCIRGDAE